MQAAAYTRVLDAQVSAYPHRLGKRHVRIQLEKWTLGGTMPPITGRDAWLEEQRQLAEKTTDCESVTVGQHNWGIELIGHKWIEVE